MCPGCRCLLSETACVSKKVEESFKEGEGGANLFSFRSPFEMKVNVMIEGLSSLQTFGDI